MRKILFASTNRGKLAEVRSLADRAGITVVSPDELPALGDPPEVAEGTISYRENALKKAEEFSRWSGLAALADDTGLEVGALGGAPGVKSARFAGEGASMDDNKKLLLRMLGGMPDRSASFRCVLCLYEPDGSHRFSEAVLEGSIAEDESGSAGFGYDTLFIVSGTGKTLAALKEDGPFDTHRARALRNLFSK